MNAMTPNWHELDAAAQRCGASFFLADPARFAATAEGLLKALRRRYQDVTLAYSYKTNYLPAFVNRAHELGAWSEVVSRYEYDYARGLGIPGDRIIFNGPVKSTADVALALDEGASVHVDSLAEVETLLAARPRRSPAPVGIRCHLGDNTPGSRFGIVLDSPEGREAVRALDATPHLRLASLHAHHSARRATDVYRERAERLVDLHREVLGGRPLDYLDIGGGLASPMEPELAAQMGGPPPTAEEYGAAIGGVFARAYPSGGPGLVLEPGIGLLSDAMLFVARVEVLKELPSGRFAVVDGSVFNIKPLRHDINLPVRVAARPGAGRQHGPFDLVGHTCMEKGVDMLHHGCAGPLAVGDFVVFRNIGAYSTVLNAPFIRGTPPILELVDGRPGRVLRRGSTAADLLASYREP